MNSYLPEGSVPSRSAEDYARLACASWPHDIPALFQQAMNGARVEGIKEAATRAEEVASQYTRAEAYIIGNAVRALAAQHFIDGATNPLKEFARYIIAEGPWQGGMPDGGSVQDKAVKLGLLEPFKISQADIDTGNYPDFEVGDKAYRYSAALAEQPKGGSVYSNLKSA